MNVRDLLLLIVSLSIVLPLPAHADAAAWSPTGGLNVARSGHTATLLNSGKVLVVGGGDNSAELYDPATGKWSLTGRLNTARSGHTATLLRDGRVLVSGGDTSVKPPSFDRTSSAELYDPSSQSWTLTGFMGTERSGHSSTLLMDGKVLVAGGFAMDTLGSSELYDPASATWSPTGNLATGRYWHAATLLQNGTVLVVGGSNSGDLENTLGSTELYDPTNGVWSAIAGQISGGVLQTSTLMFDGRVLVAGGNGGGIGGDRVFSSSELFDPARRTWSTGGNLAVARYGHSATLLPAGKILVAGGQSQENHYPNLKYINLDSVEIYDSIAGAWSSTASLGNARSGHTATLLPDGRVLVAGGSVVGPNYTDVVLDSAELYGPAPLPGTGTTAQVQTAVEYYLLGVWDYGDAGYFVTAFPEEIAALDVSVASGSLQHTGESFKVWSGPTSGALPTCRFWSPNFLSHFYTPYAAECAAVQADPNWQYEGIAFYLQVPDGNGNCPNGTTNLLRLYNNGIGGTSRHRLTTSVATFTQMRAAGWGFEGDVRTFAFACVPSP